MHKFESYVAFRVVEIFEFLRVPNFPIKIKVSSTYYINIVFIIIQMALHIHIIIWLIRIALCIEKCDLLHTTPIQLD
jgi:hypothetical protein